MSGRLKVAPEHTSDRVLRLMRKPPFKLFGDFKRIFDRINREAGLRQQIIPYFIYHPALTYFANEYGFRQIAIEEEGREPSVASLAEVIREAKRNATKIMFVQKEFDSQNTETVVKETKAQVVEINPLDYNWEQQMTLIASTLSNMSQN